MLEKVLIANRGEIACRIIQSCRKLGVGTVAVYSDADAGARHVRIADEAIHIGAAPPTESYLSISTILDAARQTGARAIHPGYGFLSENADFAQACQQAGVIFIGPTPDTIARMGSKAAAKKLMESAGVPTIPGYHGTDQSDDKLATEATRIGFPLLVKASAGGGGKGMRIAGSVNEVAEAVVGARREAQNAFGDDRLLLEKYLDTPRHIEFQVFGDNDGNIVHLYERECSIQRRYQKIIEESPSPFLDQALREKMGQAAIAAARAVAYRNAGTIEFMVDAQRQFYFLEMNTRLQVEHPVSELTTGLDLVEWQLRVAAGEQLPLQQKQIKSRGHAIEARIYAENPDQDFLPSTGRIHRFAHATEDEGVRLDSGFEDGDVVSIYYDPMIAKLICSGADRQAALARLRLSLAQTAIFGPMTNLPLLRRIAADAVFAAGEAHTGYIDENLAQLLQDEKPDSLTYAAAAVSEMQAREKRSLYAGSPWDIADGWQANGRTRNRLVLRARGQQAITVDIAGANGRYTMLKDNENLSFWAKEAGSERLIIESPQRSAAVSVLRHGDTLVIANGDRATTISLQHPYPPGVDGTDEAAHPGSPMPGRIVAIKVAAGDQVQKGQALVILEGMKMEFTVQARSNGRIEKILYQEGDMVDAEVPLVEIEPDREDAA
ncbi:MAG: acetyl-CoA carboxylase biotin carboxylase subunit [Gammaproteobacteria bacterium]|nr:acetyl-CoA carboxylase biotin carboxylase subunit [Gammaproteobacteria bacterium]